MKIKSEEVEWAPKPNKVDLYMSSNCPQEDLVTSAFGIIWHGDKICLIEHMFRGMEIPGGHREKDEFVIETLEREIEEECGLGDLHEVQHIAYQKISLMGEKPAKYAYPYPVSYQCFYVAKAKTVLPFHPNLDSIKRIFLTIPELKQTPVYEKFKELFDLVL